MKKTNKIALAVIALLILGAIFVSAYVSDNSNAEQNTIEEKPRVQEECSASTCNFNCGGNCGVPTCGCGR